MLGIVPSSVIARAAVPPDNAHQHFRNRFPILFARYRFFHCHCEAAARRGNLPIRICRGRCPHRPGKPQACAMLRIAGRMKASAPTMSNAPRHTLCHCEGACARGNPSPAPTFLLKRFVPPCRGDYQSPGHSPQRMTIAVRQFIPQYRIIAVGDPENVPFSAGG